MRTPNLLTTTSLALALSILTSSASAAPSDPAITARATELFRAGRAAATAGDNKTACDRFTESEQLQPAPGTQLNLGACEEKQGHLLAARDHFRKAADAFGPEDRRRAVALNTASALTERLATLTVHVPAAAPEGLHVSLDGAALDPAAAEHGLELDPGKKQLVVEATGRQPRTVAVDLAEGEKREVTADAGDALAPEEPPAPLVAHDDGKERTRALEHTLGFVGMGVGAAGVVVGGVFGGLALHQASVEKTNCNTKTWACNATGVSAASSGSTDAVVSTVGFIAGAAFAAAGVYLFVSTSGSAPHATATGLTITPMTSTRDGQGVMGTWVF